MPRITLFSWGYYGWGNHTPALVRAVDAVEAERGYGPPIFVDIRIRRAVRAPGFREQAFGKLLGPARYRWMQALGNKSVLTQSGPTIQIADPSAADELLDLACAAAQDKRRVVFFCSCQWPKWDGKINCHRVAVARLVLRAARRRRKSVQIVEWPGGTPRRVQIDVAAREMKAVRKGRMTIPLGTRPGLAQWAGLPWGSIASLHCGGETLHRGVGPAVAQKNGWVLPVCCSCDEADAELSVYREAGKSLRQQWGFEPLTSQPNQ